jgi:hypothetical protein
MLQKYLYLFFSAHKSLRLKEVNNGEGSRVQCPRPRQPGLLHVQARVRDHLRVHRGFAGRFGESILCSFIR